MAADVERPVIVIVGPTASGKTALAIRIAQTHDGEIICADSRTVFQDMNIGTAKPDATEQAGVPHWGLDLCLPGERFTAAAFQQYANERIDDIRSRGKLPIVVGGTGLYVDGLVYEYQYPAEPSDTDRNKFESMSQDELYKYCIDNNIELPLNDKNKRHLVRSVVHQHVTEQRREHIRSDVLMYGIAVDKATSISRIATRTEHMFDDGVVDEAKALGKKYGWDSEAMSGNIYPLLHEYVQGERSLAQAKEAFRHRDWQLAKRQMTWFRRNPEIAWGTVADIEHRIEQMLASG